MRFSAFDPAVRMALADAGIGGRISCFGKLFPIEMKKIIAHFQGFVNIQIPSLFAISRPSVKKNYKILISDLV